MNDKFTLAILAKLIIKKLYYKRRLESYPNNIEYQNRLKEVELVILSIKKVNNECNK
jgi:hypothetical protein